jgi:hypothetical protein
VGVADDPTVANPLLRQQMLSTEWFGCVFQLEGVLVKSRFKEHKMSWKRLAEEREVRVRRASRDAPGVSRLGPLGFGVLGSQRRTVAELQGLGVQALFLHAHVM